MAQMRWYRAILERSCRARGGEPSKIWAKLKYVSVSDRLKEYARRQVLRTLVGVTRHSIATRPPHIKRLLTGLVLRKAQRLASLHGLKMKKHAQ